MVLFSLLRKKHTRRNGQNKRTIKGPTAGTLSLCRTGSIPVRTGFIPVRTGFIRVLTGFIRVRTGFIWFTHRWSQSKLRCRLKLVLILCSSPHLHQLVPLDHQLGRVGLVVALSVCLSVHLSLIFCNASLWPSNHMISSRPVEQPWLHRVC